MMQITVTLPTQDTSYPHTPATGPGVRIPVWELSHLTYSHDVATVAVVAGHVELDGLNYYAGEQVDALEADALRILAAVAVHRQRASEIDP